MNRKSIMNRVYLPILCLLAATACALRIAAMMNNYDFGIGYFDKKGLINAASVIAVCGCVLLFTYAFVGSKKEKLIATFTTPETYIPSVTLITALIFFAVKCYERIADFDFSIPTGRGGAAILSYIMANIASYVSALLVPLALLSAVYFALNMTVADRYSTARAAFGICAVLFFAFYASFLYFDTTLAINAPNKIVDQMAFIFAALFFLYEVRISLARECWHLYIAFGFIGALLGIYSSLPSVVIYFVKDSTVSHSIEESVLMLCISLFILSRLILAGRLNPDRESEFVCAVRERADERNRYITEKEEIERRAYIELYNRMSEIEEAAEDVNENEMFGTGAPSENTPEQDAAQGISDSAEELSEESEAPETEADDSAEMPEADSPEAETDEQPNGQTAQEAQPEADDASAEEAAESAEAEPSEAEPNETEADGVTAEEAAESAEDTAQNADTNESAEESVSSEENGNSRDGQDNTEEA